MKSLKQTEDKIRLTLRSGDANFAMAYDKMLSYYAFVDFANSTNHCKIIGMLYNFSKHKTTYTGIAMQCNVSESTLKRNRTQYVKCFYYYLSNLNRKTYREPAYTNALQNKTSDGNHPPLL